VEGSAGGTGLADDERERRRGGVACSDMLSRRYAKFRFRSDSKARKRKRKREREQKEYRGTIRKWSFCGRFPEFRAPSGEVETPGIVLARSVLALF
jgi:hypothetical protein